MDYFFDTNRLPSFLVPFVSLSYRVDPPPNPDSFPNSSYYDIGYLDVCLIVTIISTMAILRDATRILLFEPFANWQLTRDWRRRQALKSGSATPDSKASNVKTNGRINGPAEHSPEARRIRHSVVRFAEQGWQVVYYSWQWSLGVYIHYYLPSSLWAGYPHIHLPGIIKVYYLMQMSLYVHLVLLLNAEAPRKDHWQMMTHHVVTIVLIVASYAYNFTRVGCLIMVLMDWCDIFFPLVKMLRYLQSQPACDIVFVWWMLSWFVTRHVLFCKVIASAYWDAPNQIEFGWWPERGHWLTREVHKVFVSLLVILEIIQTVWSYLICCVAYRVIKGEGADDSRSDDEG
ncbi:longevity assurance proteins LAG1/LAC1 [Russula decolorans]